MVRIVYIAILSLCLGACKTHYVEVPVKQTKEIIVTETVHDSTIVTQTDSTWYYALIECQNGKPVLKNATKSNDKPGLKAPEVSLDKDGKLNVACEKLAEALFLQWKSTYEKEVIEKEIPIYIEKPLSKWQRFILSYGTFACILSIMLALFGAYKVFKK